MNYFEQLSKMLVRTERVLGFFSGSSDVESSLRFDPVTVPAISPLRSLTKNETLVSLFDTDSLSIAFIEQMERSVGFTRFLQTELKLGMKNTNNLTPVWTPLIPCRTDDRTSSFAFSSSSDSA